ncbi:hypothetical protein [uncultured Eubacterium sp.]|jgi:hypothetical protein|uniref:hypothetical protein n=1 Tax=uncultured Eubacterium sp. TaxID=165185 RepID=UPI00262A59FE|nr:hypothetical protein [uncultured Eubacterium sp.]
MIETHINARNYDYKEVVRICNIKQQIFYMSSGVYPIDIYPSYDEKNDRKIIIMIFEKSETKDLYNKWCNYETDI